MNKRKKMGLFKKLFKSDCEGIIEAYLQTYKKIKNASHIAYS
jgi:hypothetical protein